MRLTLTVLALITAIAVVLLLFSVFNAGYSFTRAAEMLTADAGSPVEVEKSSISVDQNPEGYFDARSAGDIHAGTYSAGMPEVVSITVATQFNTNSIIYTVIVIAAGGVITWFVLGRALRPVKKLSAEIAEISENDLDTRITGFKAGDEISSLADSFNFMLERLEAAFESQKSFSSAAAHELKTPLATIKARLDVTEMNGRPDNGEYAKLVNIVRKHTDRMIGIVDDLFLFSMTNEHEFNDRVVLERLVGDVAGHNRHLIAEKNSLRWI
jgi:signal transduction histidine kinase